LGDASLSAPPEEQLNGKALQFVLNTLTLSGSKTATLQASHDRFNNRSKARYVFTVIQKPPFSIKVKCLEYAVAQCLRKIDNIIYLHVSTPPICAAPSQLTIHPTGDRILDQPPFPRTAFSRIASHLSSFSTAENRSI